MCASLGNKNNYHMFQLYFQRFSREMDKLMKNKRLLIKVDFEKNTEIIRYWTTLGTQLNLEI